MKLSEPVTCLTGVGEKTAKTLKKVEIGTIRDLVYYLPRAYKDFSVCKKIGDVKFGETAFFKVKVFTPPQVKRIRKGLDITSFQVTDATGIVTVDIFNQVYIKNNIVQGKTLYLYGKLEFKYGKMKLSSPEIYFKKPEDNFLPIYPLTAGLNQNMMRKFSKEALRQMEVNEPYSDAFLREFKLYDLKSALQAVHFPSELSVVEKARTRVVFDLSLIHIFSKIVDTPVVADGKLEAGKVMSVSLSIDHRVTDGASGARMLQDFVALMEAPQDLG